MNYGELNKAMIDAGMKRKDLAKAIGISEVLFNKKVSGQTDIWMHEVRKMVEVLRLDERQIKAIFFDGMIPTKQQSNPIELSDADIDRIAERVAYSVVKVLAGNFDFHDISVKQEG